ncbi:MAG: sodium-dependent transporter [Candidatus Omnitrophica bacterium]|nr:sodium-dependent transporter [Candidatus Omnitrophota bacterium]MCM8806612.1 sodium-dependent transporter [Candidatus Omnitrophota bacterium]
MKRERWGSKIGVILAVAGSAVGLGNFLRFPVQAVKNGGGAFMIPYFISLFLLGIPLMWIEWTIGRFGGGFGHGTAPGIFHTLWRKNRFIKYFGVIGIFGPIAIFIYYTYIESWLLAYTFFPLRNDFASINSTHEMVEFLNGFRGIVKNQYFSSILTAYIFFILTFSLNLIIIYFGIKRGIERVCKVAMPTLFLFAIILVIRVLTLKNELNPDWSPLNGLGFLWNPEFSSLKDARVWLSAAGQIFFTLSVGIGVILTYASYLSKDDDVLLSGLTSASTNEFAEVILGGSIVIPAAFVFFGPVGIKEIANQGSFDLGFVTMPLILKSLSFGRIFEIMWFFLLFLAGLTSSISLAQPAIAFLEDEFNLSKKKCVLIFGIICFLLSNFAIFFLSKGVIDELDFWGGTFALVIFATIETILFAWIFGMENAWEEMHSGSDINLPSFYKFIIKYITPSFLIFILLFWTVQYAIPTLLLKNVKPENLPYILITRFILLVIFVVLCILVKISWDRKGEKIET